MLNEHIARGVGPTRIDIAYEQRGNPAHPTVLLVMGIAAQLVHWPLGFLEALVQRGLHVVRFDNRDSGRSTHLREAPPAELPAALRGNLSSVSYTLSDMAADAVGLLDVLNIDAAHVVGASMGGAIAQTVAIEHPARVCSLTSMMFTTGDMAVGQVHPATMKAVFGGPPARTREEVIASPAPSSCSSRGWATTFHRASGSGSLTTSPRSFGGARRGRDLLPSTPWEALALTDPALDGL